jgi:hypothetical protein
LQTERKRLLGNQWLKREKTKTTLTNQINEEDQDNVDDIRKNAYKGQNYNPNLQSKKSNGNEPNKCAYYRKPGHQLNKYCTKFLALILQSRQRANNNGQKHNNGTRRY